MPPISLFTFLAKVSGPEEALKECSHGAAFDRGLPTGRQLTSSDHVAAVQFISHLLQFDGVMVTGSDTLPDGAQQAHKLGWITLDEGDQRPSRQTFLRFAAFSSNALREPCRHTYGPQALPSLPESQWQMNSIAYGTGQLSNEKGAKGWGIELLREGDRMEEHLQRFAPTGAMNEYVVFDLRTHTIPRALTRRLIHYEIKDHNLLVIKAGNLLANGLSSISG
ncbi:hypothetical protein B0H13DRAFT_1973968 [Mycena leptocephala]|nr:hypothetical protein B0H13DRAFT_1973968 [Mycena leptocephala]